jgi:hypothetical protein
MNFDRPRLVLCTTILSLFVDIVVVVGLSEVLVLWFALERIIFVIFFRRPCDYEIYKSYT